MTRTVQFMFLVGLAALLLISGCNLAPATPEVPSTTPLVLSTVTLTELPTATVTPTFDPNLVQPVATVWSSDPLVPILTYHRFKNDDPKDVSDSVKVKYSDFRAQLQALYDAGYSLVPLEAWIKGDLAAPEGRKPLVLSLDDLYFADQLFINEDGTPSDRSGLGILWEFSQQHPDFGYNAALFYNLGDKLYGNIMTDTWFIQGDGWEEALARTIVWGIDHNLLPYNHFYTHPLLSKLDGPGMLYQYQENERRMQQLLTLAGRPELFDTLGNMIALTYGEWPGTHFMNDFVLGMPSLTRKPLLAVFEIDYSIRAKYMLAPYAEAFNRYHIPRIVANQAAIDLLVSEKDQFPTAGACQLAAIDKAQLGDGQALARLIQSAVQSSSCPDGIYALEGKVFRAQDGTVSEIGIPLP